MFYTYSNYILPMAEVSGAGGSSVENASCPNYSEKANGCHDWPSPCQRRVSSSRRLHMLRCGYHYVS